MGRTKPTLFHYKTICPSNLYHVTFGKQSNIFLFSFRCAKFSDIQSPLTISIPFKPDISNIVLFTSSSLAREEANAFAEPYNRARVGVRPEVSENGHVKLVKPREFCEPGQLTLAAHAVWNCVE